MQTHTMPIAFVRDIVAALGGTNAIDFDAADFDALPAVCRVAVGFGLSHSLSDTENAVKDAWPYPAGTEHVDAIVAIRGNGTDMVPRYKAIQDALRIKLHDTSTLLLTFGKSTLPPGAVSIIILAITRDPT